MHLDALLADEPLAGGLEPRLGSHHLRTLTIVGFPTTTHPGILDELNRLAFPHRWSTRAILLDKTEAVKLLTKIRRQWFAKRKSIAAIVKEVMTNEASTLVDSDAANKAADADLALQELGTDDVGQAYITATVTVWDEDPGLAAEKLRLVEKVIQGRDFTCMPEGVNALEAWFGSIPGHAYANVRQPPVSTLNLAHMIPLSAVWAGPARDEHFQAPPLLFGKTEGSTPFRLSLHVGDVGHTLIVGPTGAGKSVLLSLMAMQFRRYRNNQIFAFDFGGSIRTAALAMGGDWHDLGGSLSAGSEHSVSLQPLARIDDQAERAWAAEWVTAILAKEGVTIDPVAKEHVWSALSSLASSPVGERTITGLAVLLQSTALKQALQPYCVDGPSGRLLDAEGEQLGSASVQAFETEGLIGAGAASAVLTYLFHRIEGRLDGRPTLLIIDEGWLVLDDPAFAQQLREWLKTLRKKNASVVFATQSLSDIDGSNIAPAIVESCPTRIFLPNERAISPWSTGVLRRPSSRAFRPKPSQQPLLDAASQMMGFTSFFANFVQIAVLMVSWLLVLIAFFILAVQLFVTLIEFKLTTLAGFILIPFALFNKTAFLAEKVLGNIVASGVKVMVLAVIVGIGTGLFSQFTQTYVGGQPTVEQALSVVLAALAMLGLGIFGPGIATGLVSGAPQLGAGAAVGTGLAVAGTAMAGAGALGLAGRGAMAAASGAAAAARGGAAMAGGASSAYSLASAGRSGASGVGAGLGGVGRAAASSAVAPIRRAAGRATSSMKDSFASGARSSFAATGGTSTMGTVGGAEAAETGSAGSEGSSSPPAWARRMKRTQSMTHGAQTAAQVLKSGDSHGGGHSVDLSGGE